MKLRVIRVKPWKDIIWCRLRILRARSHSITQCNEGIAKRWYNSRWNTRFTYIRIRSILPCQCRIYQFESGVNGPA